MAAFVTDAVVVHGDRPKLETYQRLSDLTSLADLDQAIAAQVWRQIRTVPCLVKPQKLKICLLKTVVAHPYPLFVHRIQLAFLLQACINFADTLGHGCGHDDLSRAATVHQIFTLERDQVLCQSLQHWSLKQPEFVLGVVGVAHVPGIVQCWEASTSSGKADAVQDFGIKPIPSLFDEDCEAQGVRRALLERFLELSCSAAVIADMQQQLPALPVGAEEAYCCARELYGSPRMLLAALPRQYLNKASFSSFCKIPIGPKTG